VYSSSFSFIIIHQTTTLDIRAYNKWSDKLISDGIPCQPTKSRASIRRCILQFPDES
jgi:hypothetical protein